MSIRNLFAGQSAEYHGRGFLLNFLTIGKPEPDISGIDCSGQLRKDLPQICDSGLDEDDIDHFHVNFQIKTGLRFKVRSQIILGWANAIERQSVILLWVKQVDTRTQHYYFLVLHDWLLEHPSWVDLDSQKTKSFPPAHFALAAANAGDFVEALVREAKRVLKKPGAQWQTRARSPILPLTEADLFRQLGHLGELEVPKEATGEARKLHQNTADSHSWDYLHTLWVPRREVRPADNNASPTTLWVSSEKDLLNAEIPPAIRKWLADITKPTRGVVDRERFAFSQFVAAMRSNSGSFPMPAFTWADLSCWRIFFLMFPEAIRLIERLLSNPYRWGAEQQMSTFLLASAAAHSENPSFSNKAIDRLRDVAPYYTSSKSSRYLGYERYRVVRQYLFARAEAEGDNGALKRCLVFLDENNGWEQRLNREYYRDETHVSTARATLRKLESTKARDLNTRKITNQILQVSHAVRSLIDRSPELLG